MRRRAFRIRRWLLLAVAVSALAISSTAQARFYSGEDQGRVSGGNAAVMNTKSAPVAGPGAGFDWGYAMVGVGTVLLAGITGVGLVQLGRNRRRLATLL